MCGHSSIHLQKIFFLRSIFGHTGHQSTRTLFGAAALSRATQEEADRTLEVLLKYGVNHIDTAARYGDSEVRLGPWMALYRQHFFLATKTREHTYQGAWDGIRHSLERLQVEHAYGAIGVWHRMSRRAWRLTPLAPGRLSCKCTRRVPLPGVACLASIPGWL